MLNYPTIDYWYGWLSGAAMTRSIISNCLREEGYDGWAADVEDWADIMRGRAELLLAHTEVVEIRP